jgi:quinoprotein glucose dehydrogenase
VPAPERPVPQGAAPGDWVSPTQPLSELSFRPQTLTETDMWGITPLDHLWCRIQFHRHRYEGMFTPPTVEAPGTLIHPGHYGVFNWGSAAVDEGRQIMVVNPGYIPYTSRLRPTAEAADKPPITTGESSGQQPDTDASARSPISVPFVAESRPFLSPLGIPCNAPPWGYLAAVDMRDSRVLWQRPIGTTRDLAPLGLSLPLGVPSLGGPIITAGGLVLLAGTLDNYLRAFDLRTGEELWRGRLPAGGQATPMNYTGKSGRQFVVIAAGGHSGVGTTPGDHVVAYALRD